MAKRKARTALVDSSTRQSPATRNAVACNPLLGKGSVHGKSKKANRRADKVSLLKALTKRGGSDPEGYLQSDSILQIVFCVFACSNLASPMYV